MRTVYVIEEKTLARLKAGGPFPMVGLTSSVAGPTFLHINNFDSPSQAKSAKAKQSEHARELLAKASIKGVNVFSRI